MTHDEVKEILWYLLVMGFPVFAGLMLRTTLEEVITGIVWRFKSGYDNDEIVCIDGEWGRITHMGFIRTRFIMFEWDGRGPLPAGGLKMSILNSELRKCRIKQQLEMVARSHLPVVHETPST